MRGHNSFADLIAIITELRENRAGFAGITGKIDTPTATGELTFHIFAALAQCSVSLFESARNPDRLPRAPDRQNDGPAFSAGP